MDRQERYRVDPEYRQRIRDAAKRRYANNPEQQKKALERAKRRVEQVGRGTINAAWRKWARTERGKESIRSSARKHRQSNLEYYALKAAERRARKLATQVEFVDYQVVLEKAQGNCGICGEHLTAPIEIDHIIPLSRGGTHTYDNLQATHATCNRQKWIFLPSELVNGTPKSWIS